MLPLLLPEEMRLLVHSWCWGAATWSMQKLPHLREVYFHAFVLLCQGPNSPAQVPHIDLLPGAYQGSLHYQTISLITYLIINIYLIISLLLGD